MRGKGVTISSEERREVFCVIGFMLEGWCWVLGFLMWGLHG